MHSNDQIAPELPDLQDQELLTLRWRSYWEWGRERVALSFAYKSSQYHIYEWPQPMATQVNNDARLKIAEAPLTLIFSMGQGACGSLLYLEGQPMPHLWMAATDRHADYAGCKTKNRWRSVHAHIQNGAGRVRLSLVPKTQANSSFVNGLNRSPHRLPLMQVQKL